MSTETRRLKFLQVSDVHLDCQLTAFKLNVTRADRMERMREIVETFLVSLEVAKQENVDAVLIPGNLWDNETLTAHTASKIISAFEELGDIPVFITPGESDAYGVDSFYNPNYLYALGLPQFPGNVRIFQSDSFTIASAPMLPGVSFIGRANLAGMRAGKEILRNAVKPDRAAANILILNGGIEGHPEVGVREHPATQFTFNELERSRFEYAALGSFPNYTDVRSTSGQLIGAYAGTLCGRGFDELGPRYALLVVMTQLGAGDWQVEVDSLELDRRRLLVVGADITGLEADDIVEEIAMHIDDQGGRADRDLIQVYLEGAYRIGTDAPAAIASLHDRYLHLVVVDKTRPDYLSAHLDQRTTEWKYIESLLEMKRGAEMARSGEYDTTILQTEPPASRDVVEDALYYGLDALRHKKVTVRDVD